MTSRLTVLSRAASPVPDEPAHPPLPGFMGSSFSPLVAAVAGRCLAGHYGTTDGVPAGRERTGLVLATVRGDVEIARRIVDTVDAGRRMSPLLFFQSIPNGVLGHIATEWGLGGPVVCVSPLDDPQTEALALAADLIDTGDADAVLVLTAEQDGAAGRATATLVEKQHEPEESTP